MTVMINLLIQSLVVSFSPSGADRMMATEIMMERLRDAQSAIQK